MSTKNKMANISQVSVTSVFVKTKEEKNTNMRFFTNLLDLLCNTHRWKTNETSLFLRPKTHSCDSVSVTAHTCGRANENPENNKGKTCCHSIKNSSVWQGRGSTNLRLYCRLRFSTLRVHRTRIHGNLVLNRISNPLSSWISYEFKERGKEAGEQI